MNEDPILEPKKDPSDQTGDQITSDSISPANTQNQDLDDPSENTPNNQVFDITPDFNIQKVNDDVSDQKNEPVKIPYITKPIPQEKILPDDNTIEGPVKQDPIPNDQQKAIRTYEGDVAEAMANKRSSVASIAIAETKKKDGEERVETKEKSKVGLKLFITLISLLFIGGGVIGAYYLYSISPLAPTSTPTTQPTEKTSIVKAETQMVIDISGFSPIEVQRSITNEINKPQQAGTIKEIVMAKKTNNSYFRVTGPEMVDIADIDAPDVLKRSLTNEWMLGVYSENGSDRQIFVVATTNFFQNAFAGMLQWESVMMDDLKFYLYPQSDISGIANTPVISTSSLDQTLTAIGTSTEIGIDTSTSTGSSSPIEILAPMPTLRGRFEDRIIKNRDARVFRSENGEILLLYSFIDNARIIIANKESVLIEILSRLEKETFVR